MIELSPGAIVVLTPEDQEIDVRLGPLAGRVQERAVPANEPPPQPAGRPIWDDPNVLNFATGLEMQATGAQAAEGAVAAGAVALGVFVEEPELRYEYARDLLEVAERNGLAVVFAVGLPASASASA